MKYDFSTIIDRKGIDALAWDVIPVKDAEVADGFSRIPMWVADMNFATAPSIQKEIIKRAQHPCFGYFQPTDDYYDSIIFWQEMRNGVKGLSKENIGYENGVLGGVTSALNAVCCPGDKILLHTPAYIGFTHVLENCGYHAVCSALKPDENNVLRMDLEDMEEKLKQGDIRAAILCSPHNPSGRVWSSEELKTAAGLFEKYEVTIISDEIWSDLILDENRHTPTQSVSEYARSHTIALYAPTKTFNLAGLVGSYHIIYDRRLRSKVDKIQSLSHYNEMNVLSMHAQIGAYSPEGAEWTDELRAILTENVRYACEFIRENFPGVDVRPPQGTYMLFLDCRKWCESHGKSLDELLKAGIRVGVIWQDGRPFHGECHIRMNLALPKQLVQEAFDRLKKYVFT